MFNLLKVCTPADWKTKEIPMIDTSVTPFDINRLFRTGVVTYRMPSGKSYMRTIGKQKIEASLQDEDEKESTAARSLSSSSSRSSTSIWMPQSEPRGRLASLKPPSDKC